MDDIPNDDPLVTFSPVPSADGWTPDRQHAFIAELARHGSVSPAARAVGMTPQTTNRLRRRAGAEGSAHAWEVVAQDGRLRSQDEAVRRGVDGWLSPILRDGRLVGHRRRFDNRLLFAACYGEPMTRYARTYDRD